jgi:hypothetical protein
VETGLSVTHGMFTAEAQRAQRGRRGMLMLKPLRNLCALCASAVNLKRLFAQETVQTLKGA